jgi:hypothetical protein
MRHYLQVAVIEASEESLRLIVGGEVLGQAAGLVDGGMVADVRLDGLLVFATVAAPPDPVALADRLVSARLRHLHRRPGEVRRRARLCRAGPVRGTPRAAERQQEPWPGRAAGVPGPRAGGAGRRRVVRGRAKVSAGGQAEVPGFGQLEVPAPCRSCRRGAGAPDCDRDGVCQSSITARGGLPQS